MITLFPTILIFTACFLFAFTRPKIAIYLPLVFSSAYLVKAQIFGLPSTLLEIILIAVLLGVWLTNFRHIRVRPCRQGRSPIGVAVVLFVFSTIISTLVSPHLHTSLGVLKALIIEPIIYALTLIVLIEKEKRAEGIVRALLLGGLVSVALSLITMGFGVDFGRFRGIYDVPNSLALIVAPLCAMSLVGSLLSWQPVPPTRWSKVAPPRRWLWFVLTLIFGSVLIATQSLAGILAVVIAVLIIILMDNKGRKGFFVVAILIIIGFGLQFSSGKLSHFFNQQSSSFIAREQIWTISMQMIERHPLQGTGLGTFEPAYQQELKNYLDNKQNFKFVPLEWVVRDPHNLILSFWLNTGLLGLLAMTILVVRILRRTIVSKNPAQYLLGVALLTLVIFGLFDVPYWKNDLALIWWVYLL